MHFIESWGKTGENFIETELSLPTYHESDDKLTWDKLYITEAEGSS